MGQGQYQLTNVSIIKKIAAAPKNIKDIQNDAY